MVNAATTGAAARPHLAADADCPCGGAAPERRPGDRAPRYAACCGRFVDGDAVPATALELMRSRYTAYVLGDAGYLRATWAPDTCPAELDVDPRTPRWLGLAVKRHVQSDDAHAEVEFVARYKGDGGRAARLHELSRFVRGIDGRWRYVDGDLSDA